MEIKQKIQELRARNHRKSIMQGINIACNEIEKLIDEIQTNGPIPIVHHEQSKELLKPKKKPKKESFLCENDVKIPMENPNLTTM